MNAWYLYALTVVYVGLTVYFVWRYVRYRRKTIQLEAALEKNKVTQAHLHAYLGQIEAQLRSLGCLTGPLAPPVSLSSGLGMAEMPYETWLGRIFLPRAYARLGAGKWPDKSQLGLAAVRNFSGQGDYAQLTRLLCEFDELVQTYAANQAQAAVSPDGDDPTA